LPASGSLELSAEALAGIDDPRAARPAAASPFGLNHRDTEGTEKNTERILSVGMFIAFSAYEGSRSASAKSRKAL
jgi:hypothetical protein